MLSYINSWIFSEKFWLPDNVHWSDLERNDEIFIPKPGDLWMQFPMAVLLYILRLIWEYLVADPIGKWYDLKETKDKIVHNNLLETSFKKSKGYIPSDQEVEMLSKKLDWSRRQVERWFRGRRNMGKPSELMRFKETTWRFLFYFVAFYTGLYILYDKPWFSDTRYCWISWPRLHVSSDLYWYYMIELGFYWSLILSLMKDVKRKDFWQHVIHHIVTIFLMVFSWISNFVRIGTLVLLVCDAVDYWLEAGKAVKYLKYQRFTDFMFVMFTIVWFITRLYLYPFKVMKSSTYEAWTIVGPFNIWFVFNGLLGVLMILNIMWSVTLVKMLYISLKKGQVDKDYRSDSDSD